ncbi:hypothetical protein [Halovivax limisalsi]|uniref:hypothetical protein n=1 Tax=Halovivax limisalsi TaxID=1453760 RepID=UPI001FFC9C37|nr:hypothetical protein [Halovivax limisalsi]
MTRDAPSRSAATQHRFCAALALFVVGWMLALAGAALDSVEEPAWMAAGTIGLLALSGLTVICFGQWSS